MLVLFEHPGWIFRIEPDAPAAQSQDGWPPRQPLRSWYQQEERLPNMLCGEWHHGRGGHGQHALALGSTQRERSPPHPPIRAARSAGSIEADSGSSRQLMSQATALSAVARSSRWIQPIARLLTAARKQHEEDGSFQQHSSCTGQVRKVLLKYLPAQGGHTCIFAGMAFAQAYG